MVRDTRRTEIQFVPHSEHVDVSQNRIHDIGLIGMLQLPWSSAGAEPLCTDSPWNWTTIGVWGSMDRVTSNTGCPSRSTADMFASRPSLHFASPSAACRLLHVFAKRSSVAITKRTQLHCRIFRLLSSSCIMSKEPNLHRTCGTKSCGVKTCTVQVQQHCNSADGRLFWLLRQC